MIKSMTGFGRAEFASSKRKFTVEIKSVNHRYLDLTIKMPKKLNIFEAAIRNELKNYIQRGKVDVYITMEDFTEDNVGIKYNREVAAEYLKYLKQMSEEFELDCDVRASVLAKFPEVFTQEELEIDEDEIWSELKKTLCEAAEQFVDSRIKEGENLKNDLIEKLDDMLTHVQYVKDRAPGVIEEYKQGLREKVQDLLQDTKVDETRLLMEVTLFADKVCIDEEIVRLTSHIETTKSTLKEGGSCGRKLDFIAQEMNREANTMLSKSNDLSTSDHAIELKTEIEKVREQIQNIEYWRVPMDGLLIILSGFSGAGKGTLLKKLLNDYDDYAFSVSMTTRAPRPGEVDGKDYFFVTKEQFEETIAKDGLIEHATYCNNYYGTPKDYVNEQLKKGKSVILDIEVQGAMQVLEKFPDAVSVFICPPNAKIWLERLRNRGTETEEVIMGRVATAKKEIKYIDRYEFLLINDDLDEAASKLHKLIQSKRLATKNQPEFVATITEEINNI